LDVGHLLTIMIATSQWSKLAYRSGYPQKSIAAKIGVSVRQVANIINKMCKRNMQRQKWYDEHEANAVKYHVSQIFLGF